MPQTEGKWSEGHWGRWEVWVCPNCGKPYEEPGWCEGDCGRLDCERTVVVKLSEAQARIEALDGEIESLFESLQEEGARSHAAEKERDDARAKAEAAWKWVDAIEESRERLLAQRDVLIDALGQDRARAVLKGKSQ